MANGQAYLEHLRRVHFSLVVVALGLVLTSLLSRPADISRAISDLEKIQRIESLWNRGWLNEYALERFPKLRSVEHLPTTARLKFESLRGEPEVPTRLEIQPGVVGRSSTGSLGVSSPSLGLVPTLATFRRMWDGLGENLDLLSPSERSLTGGVFEIVLWDSQEAADIAAIEHGEVVETSRSKPVADAWSLPLTLHHRSDFLTRSYRMLGASPGARRPSEGVTDPFLLANVTRWDKTDDRWLSALLGNDAPPFGEVLISIMAYRTQTIHGQAALGEFYGVAFERYGPFAEAFRELDAVTSEIQDVELERLARVLENERKRTSESFQAFGLKVPSTELSRWGSPLLVLIQLYFLLHLKALASAVAATERRAAPWIGVYDNPFARTTTVLSTVLLPVAVVIMLQWDAWPSDWAGWMWSGTLMAASTALGGSAAAALLEVHRDAAS